jgi:hypothetical protein
MKIEDTFPMRWDATSLILSALGPLNYPGHENTEAGSCQETTL